MKTMEDVTLITKGDWVKIINHRFLTGWSGFVLKTTVVDEVQYKVVLTLTPSKSPVNFPIWVYGEQLLLCCEHNEKDDLLNIIDLALDMNDKEWFQQLTNQLPLRG